MATKQSDLTWIGYLAGCITGIAALTYFLGKLYIDSYYGYFSIPAGMLSFSPQEYMYYCVPVLMLFVGITPGFLYVFNSFTNNRPFGLVSEWSKKKKVFYIFFVILATSACIFFLIRFYTGDQSNELPYLSALSTGICLGIILEPVLWIIHYIFSNMVPGNTTPDKKIAIFLICVTVIYFLALLPITVASLSKGQAKADFKNLQKYTIWSDRLPSSFATVDDQKKVLDAKCLIINNGQVFYFVSKTFNQGGQVKESQIQDYTLVVMKLSDVLYITQ